MAAAKSDKANKKSAKSKNGTLSSGSQLDIIFGGPLLFVPAISDGVVTGVEVFSPNNGHPVGAVFLPGVFFSDAELNDPQCQRWPDPSTFSLLDPHSYSIEVDQLTSGSSKAVRQALKASGIADGNHKIAPGRRLSNDWEVAISISGQMSAWTSLRLSRVTEDMYLGADAPTSPTTAAMHRLTYFGVTGTEFCGAPKAPREYLRANISAGGTIIITGEVPYQPTLLHERRAVDALAKLAGLDLHLIATDPTPHKTRLMQHMSDCGHSIILVSS